MAWDVPWYSALPSLDVLLIDRHIGLMHLVCYLRDGDHVFETYWTTRRGVEAMDYSYALMDLTVCGRQEPWEDSPPGWPQGWQVDGSNTRINGRPIAQWSRLEAGRSDDLAVGALTGTREAPIPRSELPASLFLGAPGSSNPPNTCRFGSRSRTRSPQTSEHYRRQFWLRVYNIRPLRISNKHQHLLHAPNNAVQQSV